MASSSTGTNSSGSSLPHNSGSEQDLQQVMDQRKRKRMVSNRESARRSRMRKQQHLDDLIGQVGELRKENNQILTSVNVTTELCLKIEAENSVLRAQMAELSQRLQSLNEIVDYVDSCSGLFGSDHQGIGIVYDGSGFMMNQLNTSFYMNQPILASADMAMY